MADKTFKDLAESFTIFAKYDSTRFSAGAEHDIIYAYISPTVISPEDNKRLEELGWHETDADSYGYFT